MTRLSSLMPGRRSLFCDNSSWQPKSASAEARQSRHGRFDEAIFRTGSATSRSERLRRTTFALLGTSPSDSRIRE